MNGMQILIFLLCVLGASMGAWRLISQRYSLPCPSWLGWLVEKENPFAKENRSSEIIHHLNLLPGMKVLDAGCGPGRLTLPLAKKLPQGKVTALDSQERMLFKTRMKISDAGLENVDYLLAEIGEGKLPNETFDRALLVNVLGEIPNQLQALSEIFRSLPSGGILSVTETIFDPHFQRKKKVMQLAFQTGFVEGDYFGNFLAYTLHLIKP